jgi:hypothetical protein
MVGIMTAKAKFWIDRQNPLKQLPIYATTGIQSEN